jgi:uncharacterized membrane protein YfcA
MESRTNLQHTDPWNGIKPELVFACLGGFMLLFSLLGSFYLGFQPSQWPQALVFAASLVVFLARWRRAKQAPKLLPPTPSQSILVILLVAVLPIVGFLGFRTGPAFWMGSTFLALWLLRRDRLAYPFASAALFAAPLAFPDQWSTEAMLYSLGASGSVFFFDALDRWGEKVGENARIS